jgi:hypothetical protein
MTEKEILKRIYPSVVTFLGDWQEMLKEVKRLKLKEISLFLTCASFLERQKIYQALEQTKVTEIPHVHLRHDMREQEIAYLIKKFKAKVFTIHYQYFKDYRDSKYIKRFFIETNAYHSRIKNPKIISKVGGVCFDLAHIEHFCHSFPADYRLAAKLAKEYKIGCNHLSAVLPNGRSWHRVYRLSDLDYIKNIPKNYFSNYINLELVNSITEQLKFKKYIAKILAKQWNKKS